MHSIKKAARREAWYHSTTDEVKTYNFFGRLNTRAPTRRQEDGDGNALQHASTENDADSPVAEKRKKSYEDESRGFPGREKAGTFPQGPSGNLPRSADNGEGPTSSSEGSKDSTENSNPVDVKTAQSGFVDSSVGPQDESGKPRKRRMRKFMPWKREEKEQEDIERADTKDSKKKNFPKITFWSQFKAVFGSWINILLVLVPVGIALNYALGDGHTERIIVFVINFIAIVPLAGMLSYATEELAMYIGETLGGLLNATFGNAVELIVGVIALTQEKILIVQTSLIGSMLSNLLLVLGMCFFFGGLGRTEQFFNVTVAQTASSLLALAIGSLIIPTAFKIFANNDSGVTPTSRGTAVLLLVTYACYLLFQLRTHVDMYNAPSQKSPKKSSGKKQEGDMIKALATSGAGTGAAASGGQINQENLVHEEDDGGETPQLTRVGALVTLACSTVFIALCAEFMVSAIDAVSQDVSQEFIGLILLPIVGNAAEHATAVTVAIKDKMDLSIGVAVGSSLQIALLVLPFMVMLNWWGVGSNSPVPMTLDFDGFQVSVLFIAIIMVNYLIQDGKSHWLEGVLLQITYLIIAVSAWFYPAKGPVAG